MTTKRNQAELQTELFGALELPSQAPAAPQQPRELQPPPVTPASSKVGTTVAKKSRLRRWKNVEGRYDSRRLNSRGYDRLDVRISKEAGEVFRREADERRVYMQTLLSEVIEKAARELQRRNAKRKAGNGGV